MSGSGIIPKQISFRQLRTNLRKLGIVWKKRKGKGGHGSFVGPDNDSNNQAYSIPSSQRKEVRKPYLKKLCDRFGFTEEEKKQAFEK